MRTILKTLLIAVLSLVIAVCTGCTTVEFVREASQSVKQMDKLSERLNRMSWETDVEAFKHVLEDVKAEALQLRGLDTGLFKKQGKQDVLDFTDKILAIMEAIEREVSSEQPDKAKVDELLKELSDEIGDVA